MKFCSFILSSIVLTTAAQAVIVAGPNNLANGETDLNQFLLQTSNPAFGYWDNMIRVSDASGTFLGVNQMTGHGWILSAVHVNDVDFITIQGQNYEVISKHQIGQSDIKLYEITGQMPDLPAVPLANVQAGVGSPVLMIGRGFSTDTSANYDWGTPGSSDANGMHWGTNQVALVGNVNIGTVASPNNQPYLITQFTDPGLNLNSYEAAAALGDSGGGMFIYHNGWQLAGVAHFVSSSDQISNPTQYGDYSAYSNVFSHLTAISSVTGTLVPEPSVWLLSLAGIMLGLKRKRQ